MSWRAHASKRCRCSGVILCAHCAAWAKEQGQVFIMANVPDGVGQPQSDPQKSSAPSGGWESLAHIATLLSGLTTVAAFVYWPLLDFVVPAWLLVVMLYGMDYLQRIVVAAESLVGRLAPPPPVPAGPPATADQDPTPTPAQEAPPGRDQVPAVVLPDYVPESLQIGDRPGA